MTVLNHVPCNKRVVHCMYNNFGKGAGLRCLMNLKALLGPKFGQGHLCHLSKRMLAGFNSNF